MSRKSRREKAFKEEKRKERNITRADKVEEKFKAAPPLRPLTQLQAEYMYSIEDHTITVATGYAGTSKTYIAARMAARMYKDGLISRIVISRPPEPEGRSLGAFPGTKDEKMAPWVRPIMTTLGLDFSPSALEYMTKVGELYLLPLEVIKGESMDDTFYVIDEAEDCDWKTLKNIITRPGRGSKIVLAGDITQTALKNSGLGKLVDCIDRSERLSRVISHIDFNEYDDIVRSDSVKEIIIALDELGL